MDNPRNPYLSVIVVDVKVKEVVLEVGSVISVVSRRHLMGNDVAVADHVGVRLVEADVHCGGEASLGGEAQVDLGAHAVGIAA